MLSFTWRRLIRPIWDGIRTVKKKPSSSPIWTGVYNHYDQVPRLGDGFEGSRFAKATRDSTRELLQASRMDGTTSIRTRGQDSLLPMLTALVSHEHGGVNLLDFGGGTGVAFVHIVNSLSPNTKFNLHVVEMPNACDLGRQLFHEDPRIRFYHSISDVPKPIDIVHVATALQYVRDYLSLLKILAGFGARFIFFCKLSAADIPTYATAQTVYDDLVVPYWFLNVREVIQIMSGCGYELIWKGAVDREFDQSNFPPEYRMNRECNLLFAQGNAIT